MPTADEPRAPRPAPLDARHSQGVGAYGLRDVLDALLSGKVEGHIELALQVIVGGSRDHHPARLAELLQPRGDVHAVAEQVLALDHHVAEVDPDPKHDPALRQGVVLAGCRFGLDRKGTGNRVDHGAELRQ